MKDVTKIKGIVDRVEDGFAVLLLGSDEEVMIELPDCYLPSDIQEGDVVTFKLEKHSRRTKEAKKKVAKMISEL